MKIIVLIFCIAIASCSVQKKIEKSKQRVLTNKEAFNYIGSIYRELHPCANDTILKTQTDTIIGKTIYSTDTIPTVLYYKKLDTTLRGVHIRLLEDGKIFIQIPKQEATIIKEKNTGFIVDKTEINLLKDELQEEKIKNATKDGIIATQNLETIKQETEIKAQKKRGNNYVFWLTISGILFIGSHILRSKLKK